MEIKNKSIKNLICGLITPRISSLMTENIETQYNKKCLPTKFNFFTEIYDEEII